MSRITRGKHGAFTVQSKSSANGGSVKNSALAKTPPNTRRPTRRSVGNSGACSSNARRDQGVQSSPPLLPPLQSSTPAAGTFDFFSSDEEDSVAQETIQHSVKEVLEHLGDPHLDYSRDSDEDEEYESEYDHSIGDDSDMEDDEDDEDEWERIMMEHQEELQDLCIRNDIPPMPVEYSTKYDYKDGNGLVDLIYTVIPPDNCAGPRPCTFGDKATLSTDASRLKGERSVIEFIKSIITEEIVEKVVEYTNGFAESVYLKRLEKSQNNPEVVKRPGKWKKVDVTEIYAYIGASYYMGVNGLVKQSMNSVYSQNGKIAHLPLLQAFSRERFTAITRYLRFHDKNDDTKNKENRRRKIEEFINPIIANCRMLIVPSNTLVVDESLLSFKGRVIFRQYLPAKPDKYGIKFFVVCDAATGAVMDAICYVGKEAEERQTGLNTRVVLDLVKSYANSHRCVVTDRYYTSVELAQELSKMNLDCVGTTQPTRKGFPKEFANLNLQKYYREKGKATLEAEKAKEKAAKGRKKGPQNGTTGMENTVAQVLADGVEKTGKVAFLFTQDLTLVKYEAAAKKTAVHLISTIHHEAEVSTRNGKPAAVLFYNSKKFGVDLLDQLVKNYTTKRTSRRWPMRIFYWALDLAAVQAYTAYRLANPEIGKDRNYRRTFMEELADELMHEHQRRNRKVKSAHRVQVTLLEYALRRMERKARRDYSLTMSSLKKSFVEKELPEAASSSKAKRRLFQDGSSVVSSKKRKWDGYKRCYAKCGKKSNRICAQCGKPACVDHRHAVDDGEGKKTLCRVCFIEYCKKSTAPVAL